ncbi:MAG: hypothetical protein QJR08_05005 [Bacillota bacterium]|nr:hypothetical protein [Bacillota bacterium]
MGSVRELILPDGERFPLPAEWADALALLLEGCGMALEPAGPEAASLERSLAGLTVALDARGDWSAGLAAELGRRLGRLGAACTVGEPPLAQDLLVVLDVVPGGAGGPLRVVYGPLPFGWARRVARRTAARLREAGLAGQPRWLPWRGGVKVAFRVEGRLPEAGAPDLVRGLLRAVADEAPRPPADWTRLEEGLRRLADAWARHGEEVQESEETEETGTVRATAEATAEAAPGATAEAAPEATAEAAPPSGSPEPNDPAGTKENVPVGENLPGARRARVTVGRPRGDRPPQEGGHSVQVVRYRRPGGG